jgi:hypothetical protein
MSSRTGSSRPGVRSRGDGSADCSRDPADELAEGGSPWPRGWAPAADHLLFGPIGGCPEGRRRHAAAGRGVLPEARTVCACPDAHRAGRPRGTGHGPEPRRLHPLAFVRPWRASGCDDVEEAIVAATQRRLRDWPNTVGSLEAGKRLDAVSSTASGGPAGGRPPRAVVKRGGLRGRAVSRSRSSQKKKNTRIGLRRFRLRFLSSERLPRSGGSTGVSADPRPGLSCRHQPVGQRFQRRAVGRLPSPSHPATFVILHQCVVDLVRAVRHAVIMESGRTPMMPTGELY